MAVGYEIIGDNAVQVLIKLGEVIDPATKEVIAIDHKSETKLPGEVVSEDEISPVIIKAYDEGDEHTRSIFQRVTLKAEKSKVDEPEVEAEEAPAKPATRKRSSKQSEE